LHSSLHLRQGEDIKSIQHIGIHIHHILTAGDSKKPPKPKRGTKVLASVGGDPKAKTVVSDTKAKQASVKPSSSKRTSRKVDGGGSIETLVMKNDSGPVNQGALTLREIVQKSEQLPTWRNEPTWCPWTHPDMLLPFKSRYLGSSTAAGKKGEADMEERNFVREEAAWHGSQHVIQIPVGFLETPPDTMLSRPINWNHVADMAANFVCDRPDLGRALILTNYMRTDVEEEFNQTAELVKEAEERCPGSVVGLDVQPDEPIDLQGYCKSVIREMLMNKFPQQTDTRLAKMPMWWKQRYALWCMDKNFLDSMKKKLHLYQTERDHPDPPVLLWVLGGNHSTLAAKRAKNAGPSWKRNWQLYVDFRMQSHHALHISNADNLEAVQTSE
jgi:hypothetical protein